MGFSAVRDAAMVWSAQGSANTVSVRCPRGLWRTIRCDDVYRTRGRWRGCELKIESSQSVNVVVVLVGDARGFGDCVGNTTRAWERDTVYLSMWRNVGKKLNEIQPHENSQDESQEVSDRRLDDIDDKDAMHSNRTY